MIRLRVSTMVAGTLLAVATLAVLALAGVGADRPRPAPPAAPSPVAAAGPGTAVQPELADALLTPADLAPGYAPGRRPAGTAAAAPGGTGRPIGVRPVTECTQLFEGLGYPPAAGVATRDSTGPGGSLLRQALAVLPAGGATGAVRDARRLAADCRRFTATLDDGTAVTVEMTPAPLGGPAPAGADRETLAIRLLVTADDRTLEGYLTLGRVGGALSVLRELGPAGAVSPASVEATLRQAVGKLALLAGEQ